MSYFKQPILNQKYNFIEKYNYLDTTNKNNRLLNTKSVKIIKNIRSFDSKYLFLWNIIYYEWLVGQRLNYCFNLYSLHTQENNFTIRGFKLVNFLFFLLNHIDLNEFVVVNITAL